VFPVRSEVLFCFFVLFFVLILNETLQNCSLLGCICVTVEILVKASEDYLLPGFHVLGEFSASILMAS
jgi:hypothetical protein